jgi:hypothetical protein
VVLRFGSRSGCIPKSCLDAIVVVRLPGRTSFISDLWETLWISGIRQDNQLTELITKSECSLRLLLRLIATLSLQLYVKRYVEVSKSLLVFSK